MNTNEENIHILRFAIFCVEDTKTRIGKPWENKYWSEQMNQIETTIKYLSEMVDGLEVKQ